MTLAPGESRDFIFQLGYIENPQEEKFDEEATAAAIAAGQTPVSPFINKKPAHELIARYDTVAKVDAAFAELGRYWDDLLSIFSVSSGEKGLERMVNVWNQYQCMVTFNMSRSASFFESGIGRGMGFRDSNQDLVGFVHQIPERARERIIDIASTQFPDGGCYHQYQPLSKRGNNDIGGGFNDDPMWLIFGTVAYVKETGDFSILDEPVPFDNEPGSEVSLMEHLLGWCLAEMLLASAFMAIYMSLITQPHSTYFSALGQCGRLCFLILTIPYAIINLSLFLTARAETAELKQDQMLRFTDENKKLKLVVASSSVVYAAAEENYVRIHYMEGIRVKDYVLRNSMKSVESICEGKGLVRCHRSYILNPSHVKALSRGKEGIIEAEMDVDCPPIPVSKRYYDTLASLF